MKKSLIALAVASAAMAGSAYAANVEVYGLIDTSLAYVWSDADKSGVDSDGKFTMNTGREFGSRVGLRGSEDLGDGLKLGFVLETGFESDTGKLEQGDRIFGREAHINLTGDFGYVAFGRQPIFGSVLGANGLFRAIDPLFANYTEAFGSGYATASMWTRVDNAISYRTPTWGGFTGYAMYSFQNDAKTTYRDADAREGTAEVDRYASLAARYQAGSFESVLVWDMTTYGNERSTKPTDKHGDNIDHGMTATFGGNYTFGNGLKILAFGQWFKEQELNGAQAIRETLFALLSEAWGKQEIFIYCQPEFDDLIHALLTLCEQGSSNVSQIISLNNDCKTDHNLYNIHCLKMLDRLIVHNSSHIVHYYYDQVNAHIHGLKIFPYFIIAGEHLLLLSHNFKMAFLSHDIILLRTMRAEFHRIFERTLPLFEVIPNDIAYMQACMQIEESTRSDFYTLQYHPCVIFNYDEALTRSYIRMDTPYGDLMLQAIRTRWQSLEHITGHHFHTAAGTEEFLNTGITTDMTPKLFRPLSKEDRQRALDAILNVPSHKHFEVNEDFLQIPQKLMIACFDSGQVMLSYQGENNNRLVLKERSLYHSIRNFFRYLEQYELRQMHSCVM